MDFTVKRDEEKCEAVFHARPAPILVWGQQAKTASIKNVHCGAAAERFVWRFGPDARLRRQDAALAGDA
jgi:hypothetical protein